MRTTTRQTTTYCATTTVDNNGNSVNYTEVIPGSRINNFQREEIQKNPLWAKRRIDPSIYVPPSNYGHESWVLNPYHGFYVGYENTVARQYRRGNVSGACSHAVSYPTLPDISYVRDKAIIKALKKLKAQHVNLSVAFAERGKTAKMLADTARSFRGAVSSIRRGDLNGAARSLRVPNRGPSSIPAPSAGDVPKRWLEYQYGWKPLLGDLEGSARALADAHKNGSPGRISVKGYASDTYTKRVTTVGNAQFLVDTEYKRAAAVRLDYNQPENAALMQAASLGLLNPFDVAWELVPFSFMVDWFIPIGDVLNVMDAALPYSFLGGFISETVSAKSNCIASPYWSGIMEVYAYGSASRHKYSRTSLSSSPFPSLSFVPSKLPSNSNVASSLSIIASTFAR